MPELRTISLQGTVNPATTLTLISKIIQKDFAVICAQAEFALGQNGLVILEITIDNDPSAPTDTLTNIGDNILAQYSNTAYLRGNDTVQHFLINFDAPSKPAYIKVRAENTDPAAPHSINVFVTIDLTPKEQRRRQPFSLT